MKKCIFTLFFVIVSLTINAAIYLSGTFNSWAVANASYLLVDNGNGVFFISVNLAAGTHHFKLTDGTWNNSIASNRIITLAAPATIKIYAKTSKSFVCDTQDAFYITGSATGSYAWGGANMLQMNISGQTASVTTTVKTGQQGNMFRDLTPNYNEPIYRPSNFVFPTDVSKDGLLKVVVFDFATYTISIKDANIATSTGSLSGFNCSYGLGASTQQSFTVGGTYLASSITVTPPADYEISTTSGSGFQSTAITLSPTAGTVTTTIIYVRLKAGLAVGSYNNENITCTSSNATTKNITCSGEVFAATSAISSGTLSSSGLSEAQLANTDFTLSSGELVIDATKTVRSLTVAPGAKLTLSSGSLTATNGITLQSTSAGTATFVDNNNSSPQAVTATVQQYLGSVTARNYYITAPISGAIVPLGQTYYSYDETGSNIDLSASGTAYWKPEAATSSLDPRKGYIAQTSGVTTLSFTGTLNTGIQTPLTLTRTSLASKPGFNLVANPYPSYLDWKLVSAANSGLTTTAWFRTKDNSGGYIFATVNVAIPSSPVIVAVDPNTTITTLIPPMQAYWVRVNAVGSTTYAVNNTMRAHADNTSNKFKVPAQSTTPLLRLRVSNGTSADEAVVLFNANATNGMDMFDSPKMSNNSTSVPEIFTQIDSEKLVINGMKDIVYNTEIPIGFCTLQAGDFSISANELSNFEIGTRVILLDKLNPSVETELSNGKAYNFSAPVTTANIDRFSVIFRATGVATGVDNGTKLNAQVFVNANNQIAIIATEKATYSIYNAVGQLVNKSKTITDRTIVNTICQAGVYVVKLTENGNELTTRVIIK